MTHAPLDYFNYRVSPQIMTSFLINLAKSNVIIIYNALYFNINFRSQNAPYFRMDIGWSMFDFYHI